MHSRKKEGVALYLKIQEDIRADIIEGRLKANGRLPSEMMLVERYRVSRVTASKALNSLEEAGWIYRIQGNGSFVCDNQDKIDELIAKYRESEKAEQSKGFTSKSAKSYVMAGKRFLGLVLPTILDSYAQNLVDGIRNAAEAAGYYLLIRLTDGNQKIEKEAIVEMQQTGVEGILIFPTDFPVYNEEILRLKISRFPFVLLDRTLPGVMTHSVMCDNIEGARLAVQHLYDLGHRNIAFCSDGDLHVRSVADRYAGFCRQMEELNLSHYCILKGIKRNYHDFSVNNELMESIQRQKVSAFFVTEAYTAMYIQAMISLLGFEVPRDFSLLSFGNPMPAWEGLEFFTYIDQKASQIGKEAVKILENLINQKNESEETYYNRTVIPKLCVRQSTAAWHTEIRCDDV